MQIMARFDSGEVVPSFYGVVRFDYMRNQSICARIPLNVLLRLLWCIYLWLRRPFYRWTYKPHSILVQQVKDLHRQLNGIRDENIELRCKQMKLEELLKDHGKQGST